LNRPGNPEKMEEKPKSGATPAPDPPAEEAGAEEASPGGEAEAGAAAELAKLRAEKEELMRTLVRRQADFENYRKRIERERREEHDRALAAFVEPLLAVLDSFERALAAHRDPAYEEYRKGFELLYRQLLDLLARHRITRMEVIGKPFDPHLHHAVERAETDEVPDGVILEELQAGYRFRDRVLRPAMVKVAVHSREKSSEPVH
jgi:molecular chaperone GrpE